jgi:hypothetical protein
MQDVKPRLPPVVEYPEQMKLIRNVFGTADFAPSDVERKELPEPGRLDLHHSLGIVGVVKGQDVEAETVADGPRSPHDPLGEIIPAGILKPIPFQVEDELLTQLGQMPIGGVTLGEVDLADLTEQPGLGRVRRRDALLWRVVDDRFEVRRRNLLVLRRDERRCRRQLAEEAGVLVQDAVDLRGESALVVAP